MKKVTLFGLIALMVLAIAMPASAQLKLTGSYTHLLEYSNENISTENPVTNQMTFKLSSILPSAATEENAKLYITMPLQMTFKESTPVIKLQASSGSDLTWRLGYESKVFSVTLSNAHGDFGKFGDPLGIANYRFNYLIGDNTTPASGRTVKHVDKDGKEIVSLTSGQIAAAEQFKEGTISGSPTSNSFISINTWGKIGAVGYDLSIIDHKVTDKHTTTYLNKAEAKVARDNSDPISVTTSALRLTYDVNDALTLGFIGMISNQYDIKSTATTIFWGDDNKTIDYDKTTEKITADYRKSFYTLSLDGTYKLPSTGIVFGQIAASLTRYGNYKDGIIDPVVKDGTFNGLGVAVGIKDFALGNVKLGATVAVTGNEFAASNTLTHKYYNASSASWSSTYLPFSYASSDAVRSSRYYVSFDENGSLLVPNSAIVILKADGNWTLNNKALLEVSAKNGLNMLLKSTEDWKGDSTVFVNNLLQLSGNYYIYGENAEGKELAKGSKNLIKAGLYFDPRFVNVENNHVNKSFNFATRAYAGVDFKTLGLQVDADFRFTNHISDALDIAVWAKYSTSFAVASANIATDISLGYRYADDLVGRDVDKYDGPKYNAFHYIYGYVGGSTTIGNGIELTVYDAIRFTTGSNLRTIHVSGKVSTDDLVTKTAIIPENDILNVIRVNASKKLSSIYTLSAGITHKLWYNSDRNIYFASGKAIPASAPDPAPKTQNEIYVNATLTAKVSPAATITLTYGTTGLSSESGFGAGKLWNSALGRSTSGGSANVTSTPITSEEARTEGKTTHSDDVFNKLVLKPMVWDKFSIEFNFTF